MQAEVAELRARLDFVERASPHSADGADRGFASLCHAMEGVPGTTPLLPVEVHHLLHRSIFLVLAEA